jgi:hypothetical protein
MIAYSMKMGTIRTMGYGRGKTSDVECRTPRPGLMDYHIVLFRTKTLGQVSWDMIHYSVLLLEVPFVSYHIL